MRIDAHQHFWRYDAQAMSWIDQDMAVLAQDCMPEDIAPQMAAEGMQAAIAVQSLDTEADTAFLMTLARHSPWLLGIVGWTDLRAADCAERIAYWQDQGPLVGLRHLVQDCPSPAALLADSDFNHGVARLQSAGLVYDLLLLGHQLQDGLAFCARHDRHDLVIDHLGKPAIGQSPAIYAEWRHCMQQLSAMPHVSLKWSGLITQLPRKADGHPDSGELDRYLDTALRLFGPHRLLFGSDWPVCRLAGGHAKVHELARTWSDQQSPATQAALYGGTARAIYRNGLRGTAPLRQPDASTF